MTEPVTSLVVHAPNIHTGGGLHVLNAFLRAAGSMVRHVQCDARAKGLDIPAGSGKHVVQPTLGSRLLAEWRLGRLCKPTDTLLCFQGLPPLFFVSARVVVFVHNRLLVTQGMLAEYPLWVQVRIRLERWWLKSLSHLVARYVVQTPSMATALRTIVGDAAQIMVSPCVPQECMIPPTFDVTQKLYDFVYVASGEAHKNHQRLLDAWVLLAEAGLYPSLALTVDPAQDPQLAGLIDRMTRRHHLRIVNLEALALTQVGELYQLSSALIFPSWMESFGLPLLEAAWHGLPIVASELDFVRDVVVPVESFDPHSSLSIMRAVQRFLKQEVPLVQPHHAEQFLASVL